MRRTKQTARKSTGGKAPRKVLTSNRAGSSSTTVEPGADPWPIVPEGLQSSEEASDHRLRNLYVYPIGGSVKDLAATKMVRADEAAICLGREDAANGKEGTQISRQQCEIKGTVDFTIVSLGVNPTGIVRNKELIIISKGNTREILDGDIIVLNAAPLRASLNKKIATSRGQNSEPPTSMTPFQSPLVAHRDSPTTEKGESQDSGAIDSGSHGNSSAFHVEDSVLVTGPYIAFLVAYGDPVTPLHAERASAARLLHQVRDLQATLIRHMDVLVPCSDNTIATLRAAVSSHASLQLKLDNGFIKCGYSRINDERNEQRLAFISSSYQQLSKFSSMKPWRLPRPQKKE